MLLTNLEKSLDPTRATPLLDITDFIPVGKFFAPECLQQSFVYQWATEGAIMAFQEAQEGCRLAVQLRLNAQHKAHKDAAFQVFIDDITENIRVAAQTQWDYSGPPPTLFDVDISVRRGMGTNRVALPHLSSQLSGNIFWHPVAEVTEPIPPRVLGVMSEFTKEPLRNYKFWVGVYRPPQTRLPVYRPDPLLAVQVHNRLAEIAFWE
jgi:hypothetical protein